MSPQERLRMVHELGQKIDEEYSPEPVHEFACWTVQAEPVGQYVFFRATRRRDDRVFRVLAHPEAGVTGDDKDKLPMFLRQHIAKYTEGHLLRSELSAYKAQVWKSAKAQ